MDNKIAYLVKYVDDDNKNHITFVKGFSSIKFLENRFGNIFFEKIDSFEFNNDEIWYKY